MAMAMGQKVAKPKEARTIMPLLHDGVYGMQSPFMKLRIITAVLPLLWSRDQWGCKDRP